MPVSVGFTTSKRRPEMALIYVRARQGRRAYYEGKIIPHDKFVAVQDIPYIRRLVNHHGDLEVEGGEKVEPTGRAAPERTTKEESAKEE
jgi:hypothetical protein